MDASIGFKLKAKDVLNTGKKSKLQIIFKDGSIVTIGKSSTFDIAEYVFDAASPKKSKVNFGFLKGSFKSITGQIGKFAPEKFKLRTKTATIGIRGTTVVGNQDKIACTYGKINVSSHGVTRSVPAGMFSKTPKESPPSVPEVYVAGSIEAGDIEDSTEASSEEEEATSDSEETDEGEVQDEEQTDEGEVQDEEQTDEGEVQDEEQTGEGAVEGEEQTGEGAVEGEEQTGEGAVEGEEQTGEGAVEREEQTGEGEVQDGEQTSAQVEDGGNPTSETEETTEATPVAAAASVPLASTPSTADEGEATTGQEQSEVNPTSETEDVSSTKVTPTVAEESVPVASIPSTTDESDYDSVSDLEGSGIDSTSVSEVGTVIDTSTTQTQDTSSTEVGDTLTQVQDNVQTVEQVVQTDAKIVTETIIIISDLSVADVTNEIISTSTLDNLQIDTADLTKVSAFGDAYLEYGYWESVDTGAAVYTYLSGMLTSSETVDQMIGLAPTATYTGGLSAIVTDPNGATIASDGSVVLDFDFVNQSFAGNINVTQGGFSADVAGNVHKYGFDTTSVTTATSSTATNIAGDLSGQFYGTNAEAAGGSFNLTSDNVGSVNGVFGVAK
ncbi:FecR domain-containing protein [Sulfurimonas sp.]|uniref:FecR domain-containing protein n=1 Tax=Sulfurimonas sp. TaxID=2022749 RepID=UPI0025D59718|nr:FecR domain-containing protein [Sulfurimonas sp.]